MTAENGGRASSAGFRYVAILGGLRGPGRCLPLIWEQNGSGNRTAIIIHRGIQCPVLKIWQLRHTS